MKKVNDSPVLVKEEQQSQAGKRRWDLRRAYIKALKRKFQETE